MNKNELAAAIAEKAELTKKDAEKFLSAFSETIIDALKNDDKVQLIGFGTFEKKHTPAREGFNPSTKEKIQIAASNKPAFKAGKAFKDALN